MPEDDKQVENTGKPYRWVKGQSGNKNGRPRKDLSIISIVKSVIDQPADERWLDICDKGKGLSWRQAIAKALLVGAVKGHPVLMKELLDRLEGKVVQPIGGENGQPIKAEVNITVSSENSKILTQEILKGTGTG